MYAINSVHKEVRATVHFVQAIWSKQNDFTLNIETTLMEFSYRKAHLVLRGC